MTIVKIFILVVLIAVFAFTAYKLVVQIKDYVSKKKSAKKLDDSKHSENNIKEV